MNNPTREIVLFLLCVGLIAFNVKTRREREELKRENAEINQAIPTLKEAIETWKATSGMWQEISAERGRKLDLWEARYTNVFDGYDGKTTIIRSNYFTTNIYIGGKLVTNGEIKIK